MGKVKELQGSMLEIFHYVVMKFLCIVHRGQTDCATAISYLFTRIKQPDIEYWNKLKRVLCFMNQTIDDEIITGKNNLHEMQKYVNSYLAVHLDMRGHTGGVCIFGIGFLKAKSSKQKINSISSNELEVIGNSKYLTYKIWYEYFLES